MSQFIDPSVGPSLKEQFSFEHAKKAYSAGIVAAVGAAATISLPNILADGKIDGPEVVGGIGIVVGGFVAGFFAAWLPSQTPASTTPKQTDYDVVAPGDGLGEEPTGTRAAE